MGSNAENGSIWWRHHGLALVPEKLKAVLRYHRSQTAIWCEANLKAFFYDSSSISWKLKADKIEVWMYYLWEIWLSSFCIIFFVKFGPIFRKKLLNVSAKSVWSFIYFSWNHILFMLIWLFFCLWIISDMVFHILRILDLFWLNSLLYYIVLASLIFF